MTNFSIRCRHYRRAIVNETCQAHVAYASFRPGDLPCRTGTTGQGRTCPLYESLTPAEVEESNRKMMEAMANISLARGAITDSDQDSGTIRCPICKTVVPTLSFTTGKKGHVHASCSTPNCVRWVE